MMLHAGCVAYAFGGTTWKLYDCSLQGGRVAGAAGAGASSTLILSRICVLAGLIPDETYKNGIPRVIPTKYFIRIFLKHRVDMDGVVNIQLFPPN